MCAPLLIFGGVGILWAMGVIDPMRLMGLSAQKGHAGLVAVPVSAQTVPAYAQMTRDHLWNAKAGDLSVVYLQPKQVSSEMIRDVGQIVGRVLRQEKPAGYIFTANDFYPKGTRPGLVAGIPLGKRAIRVDAERVFGLQGLHQGDHFDLVSATPLDGGRPGAAPVVGDASQLGNGRKQAFVVPLVQNGLIVEAIAARSLPTTSSSLMRGTITGSKPVQEVVIAVDPDEGVRLTEALAVNAQILCFPRSGRPGEDASQTLPSLTPRVPVASPKTGGVAMIETINGTKRDKIATPTQR